MGVVTDTHVGALLARLPRPVLDAMEGVDLIIHAGDVTVPRVLDELREVAPVVAVRGNHDRPSVLPLPRASWVRVGEASIGVTHGERPTVIEGAAVLASLAAGRPVTLGLERTMARRFPGADCVVFGHWHVPFHRWVGHTLAFSPGSVYTSETHPGGVVPRGIRGKIYTRLRAGVPEEATQPRVGFIHVTGRTLVARSVTLDLAPGDLVAAPRRRRR